MSLLAWTLIGAIAGMTMVLFALGTMFLYVLRELFK